MKSLLLGLAVAALSATASFSADALKAPAKAAINSLYTGYPYGSTGFFFGLFTEGGGGSVNGSVPGVGSASLTETQAGVGATIGYAWGRAGSPVAFSVEGDFGWTNFNGNSAGLGLSGPAAFEQRFVMFTPLASMMSLLPNLPSLGTVPPFPATPAGTTASNIQLGLMGGVTENDISLNFPGVSSSKEWRVAPMIGLVAMEQLSNGVAVRSWVKTIFPDKSVCVGPVNNACGGLGQQVKVGLGIYY